MYNLGFGGKMPSLPKASKKSKIYGERKNMSINDQLRWKAEVFRQIHTPSCAIMKAIENGSSEEEALAIPCSCGAPLEKTHNLVLLTGLYSIIEKLTDITNTNTNDGFINKMEIGMSDTTPLNTQTGLIKPKFRKGIVQAYRDTTNAVFKCFFNGTQATSNTTTITIGTSTTQFTVVSGTGALYTVGESIQVGLPSPEITEITNIAGDTIQVNPPLSTIPSGGQTVKQAYTELGLFGGSAATDTIGTGTAFARTTSFTPRVKDAGYGMTVQWNISLT